MRKVIIGLVSKHKEINKKRTTTYICDEMKDVLLKNGAIAIGILPTCHKNIIVDQENESQIFKNLDTLLTQKNKEDLIEQIKLCDGIILSGGSLSDAYEVWIARYCHENDIPIIGICAGQNNIVRAIGGTTKKVNDPELHHKTDDYVHSITINKKSKFYKFVDVDIMKVNSRHKNIVDNPANLTIAAYDEYGNIEVVEDKNKTCYLGIRFHPESLYLFDKYCNNIFKKFIKLCK